MNIYSASTIREPQIQHVNNKLAKNVGVINKLNRPGLYVALSSNLIQTNLIQGPTSN